MTIRLEPSPPGTTTATTITDRPPSDLCGTWTIDPATSIGSLARRRLGLWTITDRWHGVGRIHLDALPTVGIIRFQQPSGLPVLTMALAPASLEPGDADRQRWWRLHSQSLEVLPGGAWRVMATLTTPRTIGLVELHLEVDPQQRRDRLVLRGRGVLERQAVATGQRAWGLAPTVRLELAVQARRAETVRGRVSGRSARRQDRVRVQADPRNPGPLHSTSRKESG